MTPPAGVSEPPPDLVMLLARGMDPALVRLNVVAHNPVQGEAMHKVLGYHAAKTLIEAGWTVTPPSGRS